MTYTKLSLIFLLAIPLAILFFSFAFIAHAQNPFNIEFPIPELGNCGSMDECEAYCDEPANGEVVSSGRKIKVLMLAHVP